MPIKKYDRKEIPFGVLPSKRAAYFAAQRPIDPEVAARNAEYKVITEGNPLELWAAGFHGDEGKAKAEHMIAERYWHKLMYEKDQHKTLVVVRA